MAPVPEMATPGGNPTAEKLIVGLPVAVTLKEYGVPTLAVLGKLELVIVGAVSTSETMMENG